MAGLSACSFGLVVSGSVSGSLSANEEGLGRDVNVSTEGVSPDHVVLLVVRLGSGAAAGVVLGARIVFLSTRLLL